MTYALLIYGTESEGETPSANSADRALAWERYFAEAAEARVPMRSIPLSPTKKGRTVRVRDARPIVSDGPFAETKEQLGGVVLVEVANLDAAMDWASRMPCIERAAVEIRPLMPPPASTPLVMED